MKDTLFTSVCPLARLVACLRKVYVCASRQAANTWRTGSRASEEGERNRNLWREKGRATEREEERNRSLLSSKQLSVGQPSDLYMRPTSAEIPYAHKPLEENIPPLKLVNIGAAAFFLRSATTTNFRSATTFSLAEPRPNQTQKKRRRSVLGRRAHADFSFLERLFSTCWLDFSGPSTQKIMISTRWFSGDNSK